MAFSGLKVERKIPFKYSGNLGQGKWWLCNAFILFKTTQLISQKLWKLSKGSKDVTSSMLDTQYSHKQYARHTIQSRAVWPTHNTATNSRPDTQYSHKQYARHNTVTSSMPDTQYSHKQYARHNTVTSSMPDTQSATNKVSQHTSLHTS
jgi:hypothetical protein